MTYSAHWLADVLRAAGLQVQEEAGWQSRGRAEMGTVKGVLCHHTAGPLTGNMPSLDTVQNGRPDLPGPLAHLLLARDGTFIVIAAGRCNHAGAGSWRGVTTGNSNFIGIEAENTGLPNDPWPDAQLDAYARGCAAILAHAGAPVIMCAGHKEYALPHGRKSDPDFDMGAFRQRVSAFLGASQPIAVGPVSLTPRPLLRLGSSGEYVRTLQGLLGVEQDGSFGPKTVAAVTAFQTRQGLTADGIVGLATWSHLAL